MSATIGQFSRDDGLIHTTLRIGQSLSTSSVNEIIRALQRVPGVLTVAADAEHAQAFVAHDPGVLATTLVAAANRADVSSSAVVSSSATEASLETGTPTKDARRHVVGAVGLAAMCAILLLDFILPTSPDKRWVFIMPVVFFWTFILLRATGPRRS